MLNIFQAQKLSLKKIGFSKGKSLFVIVPIALMFAIIVVAASEASNLINVAHSSIFSPIQGQNEILELSKNSSNSPRDLFSDTANSGYSATDVSLISSIAGVDNVNLITELPIDIIKTSDLFTDNTVDIASLAGLAADYSNLYTNEAFTYTEGQPIPIILNANDFAVDYEDWQGKTEIAVDFTQSADPEAESETLVAQSPLKTKALSYDRNSLIGKTFTIQIGGLSTISDVKQESTTTGFKYTQKTAEEIASEVATRKTAISKYWDYEKISTPITYTFVVAGISEGSDKTMAYVPTAFAEKLMQDYLQNEISARNGTAIPTAEQNATYTGLVYDGTILATDTTSTIFAGIRNQVNDQISGQINNINTQIDAQNTQINSINSQNQAAFNQMKTQINSTTGGSGGSGPAGGMVEVRPAMPSFRKMTSTLSKLSSSSISVTYSGMATSYAIPGLVYNKDRTTGSVSGEYTSFDFTKSVPLPSKTILVKISALENRDQVITDLNTKGYNYQDYSQYKEFNQLESYLYTILNIGSIVFMVVTALFVLINMAKFVSEGRKEIGIFRAIGASKWDISQMFILQSLEYVVISIIIGGLIGAGVIFALSTTMVASAQAFITQAIGTSMILSANIVASNFSMLNWTMIAIYSGALLLITLIVSLIPSGQAASVSPVEAIRNS